ncbi:MAG: enoyl-CoA hydratase/isomerase family protein [Lysobacterales bacterium]|nr:MAG: enoyl-CoA hydratase/isomerase family protein [Xanthomonadales bacterium]
MLEIMDHGAVREIRLARPPANALNPQLVEGLERALAEAENSAQAIVISGLPGMFSAGLDVPELLQLDRDLLSRFWQSFTRLLKRIALSPLPTVFAMTGHAPAGGIVMAVFGDYRIMPRGAFKTGMNEVQVGLVVPPPVQQALVRLIGAHRAERILVAGEIMDAQRALEIGLVDELADDPDAVVRRAVDWCERLLALPRPAMVKTRSMSRSDLQRIFENSSEYGVERFVETWFSESAQTTLRALVERLRKK